MFWASFFFSLAEIGIRIIIFLSLDLLLSSRTSSKSIVHNIAYEFNLISEGRKNRIGSSVLLLDTECKSQWQQMIFFEGIQCITRIISCEPFWIQYDLKSMKNLNYSQFVFNLYTSKYKVKKETSTVNTNFNYGFVFVCFSQKENRSEFRKFHILQEQTFGSFSFYKEIVFL